MDETSGEATEEGSLSLATRGPKGKKKKNNNNFVLN